jgi:hypothetical protein
MSGARKPSAAGRVAGLLSVALPALVLAVLAGYFAVYLAYTRSLLAFPFDYDQGEGFELYDAVLLAAGQSPYLDNAVYPFYSSNYPPVYRLMLAPLVRLFGPRIWIGRAVTFACSLVIGLLIFLAARRLLDREGGPSLDAGRGGLRIIRAWLAPLLAALAFFAANYVYYIGPLARAHIPMLMYAVAGLGCLDAAFDSRRSRRDGAGRDPLAAPLAVLGVALLITAGFTKLQAVDALAAGFGYLLLRRPRLCLQALIAGGAVSAALVAVMNAATQGQFWLNVVLANVNEYDIANTWANYQEWFRLQGALIVCSAAYVAWDLAAAARARSFRPITIWSLYFVAAAALGMLTGKWGAGPTYFVAAIAASCVCTAGLLGRVAQSLPGLARRLAGRPAGASGELAGAQRAALGLLCAAVFAWQATLNVHLPTSGRLFGAVARLLGIPAGQSSYPPYPYYDIIGRILLGHLLDPADTRNGWELARIAREAPGPVWSEEAMITLNAGKEVVTNPTQLLNLSKSGMLDTSRMIGLIDQQAFGVVIFRAQFYPPDVLAAIARNYRWRTTIQMNGFDYPVLYPTGTQP